MIHLDHTFQQNKDGASNPESTRALYEQAAALGDTEATFKLACMLYHGEDGAPDLTKARALFEEAAKRGKITAMNNLAVMLENGEGGDANPTRARALFEIAAKHGKTAAIVQLASMLQHGKGGPSDLVTARMLYQKAAALNNVAAMHNLAHMLQYGKGGAPDPVSARALYEKLVRFKNPTAITNLAYMLWHSEGGASDRTRALTLCEKAANLGYATAMHNLAMMLLEASTVNIPKAVFWVNRAALLNRQHEENLSRCISLLEKEHITPLIDYFWPLLNSNNGHLHQLTMQWLHEDSRQEIVFNWLEQHYKNDIQVLSSSIHPQHALSSLFSDKIKENIKNLVRALREKEMYLFRFFSKQKFELKDKNVVHITLGIFDNRPQGKLQPAPPPEETKTERTRYCSIL